MRPDILVLDEVLAVGDLGFKAKCLQRIGEFVQQGTTVVLVSHSVDAFQRHCDRIAWLEEGRIVACGTPTEVVPRYLDAFEGSAPDP